MSLFESNIFQGERAGHGLFGLGEVPEGAATISQYGAYPPRFPALPAEATLRSKGVTHFTAEQAGSGSLRFTFMDETGHVLQRQTVTPRGTEQAPEPDLTKEGTAPVPAYREGDGLLPGSSAQAAPSSGPAWLPFVLVGGGILVAGGIVYAATRGPKRTVAANRRRRRRRRRTSR